MLPLINAEDILLFPLLLQVHSSTSFFTTQVLARNKRKSDDCLLELKDTNLKNIAKQKVKPG